MSAKTIKTKPFLLATAGSTVDGRTIDDKMIKEMASSYNPKTYGARVNIEHIRGISADAPFHAYGDVVELSTGEVEVDFNGKKEKRLGLFGSFELLENAKKLNDAGQKVYPSIEIIPDFGGKGFAYLAGVALTDSPASIATERMQFNRTDPSRLNLAGDAAALVEFVEENPGTTEAAAGFFQSLTNMLTGFKAAPDGAPAAPAPAAAPAAAGPDLAAFTTLLEGFAKQMDAALSAQQLAFTKQLELVEAKVTKLSTDIETTPAPGHVARPTGTGPNQNLAVKDVW